MALIQGKQIKVNLTGSFTGSFTGSLEGTASWAENALTTSLAPNYTLTSSFQGFTSSYYQDSSSFDTRVDALEQFSSSLDTTFATDAELNVATASLSSSILLLSGSYLASSASFSQNITENSSSISQLSSSFTDFSGSYNTGSFTGSFSGSFSGSGANLFDIPASGIVGLNLSQISSGSVSASISPDNGLQVNTNVTATSFTGSLFGTASWAVSSSQAITASYALNSVSSSFAQTASFTQTASFAPNYTLTSSFNSFTSSYNTGSFTGSFTGSLFGTASNAVSSSFAQTASYINTLYQDVQLSGSLILDPTEDPDPSGLNLDSTSLFQSSSNTALGYDLYIRQNGNVVKWKWVEGMLETGLLYGGVVTYSGSNVFVSPGSGIIAEHNATTGSEIGPIVTYVAWNAITQSISNISTQQVTYLYIDSNGDLQQQSSRFTAQQYHDYIPLGAVGHFDYTQVSAFGGAVQTAYDQVSQLSSFVDAFGPLKVSGYGLTGQPGSLRFSIGSGTSFIHGGFYENNPEFPSQISTNAQPTASIVYVYRSGSRVEFDTNGGNLYTEVRPTQYDRDGDGTLENVGSGKWSIQRVFSDPKTGVAYIYYGQERYTTLLNALQYLPTDPFTEGDTFDFTTFIGYLVLRGNASNLTDTSNNSVINAGLFRGSGQGSGGGVPLSNLDDLTDVSITSPSNGEALIYNSGIWKNGTPTSASYALTSSFASNTISASFSISSSFADIATSSSYSENTLSASFADNATSASYALTASYVNPLVQDVVVTGSLSVTGGITGSLFGNASTATNIAVTDTTTGTGPYYLTFVDSTSGNKSVRVDSSTLTFNATTNTITVPILNTTTAVQGNTGSATSPAFSFSGDTNTGMYNSGSDILAFTTSGTDKMKINGDGNVGIGTSAISTGIKLEVKDASFTSPTVFRVNHDLGFASCYIDLKADAFGTATLETTSGYATVFKRGNSESMRITSAGNVGINTTSPLAKLHVDNTFLVGTTLSAPYFSVDSNSVITAYGLGNSSFRLDDGVSSFGHDSNGDFVGVRAEYTQGIFFQNENNQKFGLDSVNNQLFTQQNLIQDESSPKNPDTPVKWIKIYNYDDEKTYFIPAYL